MPPWSNVKAKRRTCRACRVPFMAKRASAVYCSARCQNRMRVRTPPTAKQRKAWRRRRLRQPGYRERVNAVANARATAIRRWLDEFKTTKGCCDCGFNRHASALHFDHVNGAKRFNVCNSKSISQAKAEIKKCVVRCANCHAVATWPKRLPHKSP